MAAMGKIDRFAGQWQRLRLQAPQQIEELRIMATIESAASSTRIEGAQLSNEQVKDVLAGIQIDSFRTRDEQEVRGYRDVAEIIRAQHAELQITENTLKDLHRVLLGHSEKDAYHRGNYKNAPNHVERAGDGPPIVVFRTAPPAETRWWMPRIVDQFNAAWEDPGWHKLPLINDFILWFLAIHPFEDGNGRLARAITNLLLLKAGYDYVPYASLERVVEDRKVEYYVALQTSQVAARKNTGAYGEWLQFFLDAMQAQQQMLEVSIQKIAVRQPLVNVQAEICQLITERGPLTTPELAETLARSERTVRYHLRQLVREGVLEAPARFAGRRYSLPLEAPIPPTSSTASALRDIPRVPAEASDDSEQRLSPLDFAPAFQQQVMASPNGRAYATVVVGYSTPHRTPLGDRELDAMDSFAASIAPNAVPLRATPDVAWWNLADTPRLDKLQLWLYPGPLVQVHWALDAADVPDDGLIVLDPVGLVAYWRRVLGTAATLAGELDLSDCVIGLNIQTVPSGRPLVVDMDFPTIPRPTRSGTVESAPPWSAKRVSVPRSELAGDAVLRPALDQLLRHFSYRHTDATIEAAFASRSDEWAVDSLPTRVVGRRGMQQEPGSLG